MRRDVYFLYSAAPPGRHNSLQNVKDVVEKVRGPWNVIHCTNPKDIPNDRTNTVLVWGGGKTFVGDLKAMTYPPAIVYITYDSHPHIICDPIKEEGLNWMALQRKLRDAAKKTPNQI